MGDEFNRPIDHFVREITGFDSGLGLSFSSVGADLVEAELLVDTHHLQLHGLVHGGVYCSLVETTCSVGAAYAVGADRTVVGLDNHTSFLRACRRGEQLRVRAVPLSTGKRTQLWEAQIVDSRSRLVARGQVRLLCLSTEQLPGAATRGGNT